MARHLGNTDIKSIYTLKDDAHIPEEYDRVGIATATWFIRPPRIVREICQKMELKNSQKVFVIALRLGVDRDSAEGGFYTTDACTRCGACEKICHAGNIHMTEHGVEWGHDCQQCMGCIMWCPQKAIWHPNVPKKRRRYHHPDVTLKDMMQLEEKGKGGKESD